MSIRLTWSNVNAAIADGVRIYRSTSPINPNNLPTPLTTVAGSALQYDDTTAANGVFYYYRLGFFKGSDELLSDEYYYGHFPDTGPGSQKLLRGDWKRGYFGRVSIANFITAADLSTAVGYTTGSVNTDANLSHWLKFVFNGKILFIPIAYVRSSATWRSLYDAGLVYGTDTIGSWPSGATSMAGASVLQNKKVTIAGRQYRVRLMTNSDLATDQYAANDAAWAGGEFIQLYAACGAAPSKAIVPARFEDLAALPASVTMHFTSGNTLGVMGGGTPSDATTTTSPTAATIWTPVLELIP